MPRDADLAVRPPPASISGPCHAGSPPGASVRRRIVGLPQLAAVSQRKRPQHLAVSPWRLNRKTWSPETTGELCPSPTGTRQSRVGASGQAAGATNSAWPSRDGPIHWFQSAANTAARLPRRARARQNRKRCLRAVGHEFSLAAVYSAAGCRSPAWRNLQTRYPLPGRCNESRARRVDRTEDAIMEPDKIFEILIEQGSWAFPAAGRYRARGPARSLRRAPIPLAPRQMALPARRSPF